MNAGTDESLSALFNCLGYPCRCSKDCDLAIDFFRTRLLPNIAQIGGGLEKGMVG